MTLLEREPALEALEPRAQARTTTDLTGFCAG